MKNLIYDSLRATPHKEGEKLPSIRDLMKMFSAASSTVQSALNKLVQEKCVYKIPGKGSFWGSAPQLKNVVKKNLDELLLENFNDDWESGFLKPDENLPTIKELSYRYGVSPTKVQKLLLNLESSGILKRKGRTFYFSQKEYDSHFTAEILFVTRCNSYGGFTAESERELDFLRFVYRTAGSLKYKLILLGIDETSGKLIDRNGRHCELSNYPRAVGAILSTLLVQKPLQLLKIFLNFKFPIAVWWEHPENALPKQFLQKKEWGFFNSTFGEAPGREMGKYLLLCGAKEIAYISPFHNSSWSIDRLRGLEKSFLGNAQLKISVYVDKEMASPWDFRQIARKIVAKDSIESYARKLLKEKIKKTLEGINPKIPWICVNDEVAGILIELAEENILPQPTKLYAFDNSAESYLLRLDSFDFNTEALVKQMFFYIGNSVSFTGNGFKHIIGRIIEK